MRVLFQYTEQTLLAIFILTQFLGLIFVGLLIYAFWEDGIHFSNDSPNTTNNLHAVLTPIGFVYLMGNALVIIRILNTFKRSLIKWLHFIIAISGLVCGIVGISAAIKSRIDAKTDYPHFFSLHSWIGLTTMVFFIIQCLFGLFAIALRKNISTDDYEYYASIHAYLGLMLFLLSTTTTILGISNKTVFCEGAEGLRVPADFNLLLNCIAVMGFIFAMSCFYITVCPHFRMETSTEKEENENET